MNLLYIDYGGVVSDTYMYQYYGDLYRELRKLVKVYLYQEPISDMGELLNSAPIKFDCVIFGLGYFAQNNAFAYRKISGLNELDVPVVCMLHKPQTMLSEKLQFCKTNNVDLLLDSQCTHKEFEKITGVKTMRFPFTATPQYFYPRDVSKIYDIGFCGALHGNGKIEGPTRDLRERVYKELQEKEFNVYWNASNTLDYRINSKEEYATKINQCKIWLATTGPVLDVSPRYFEVMLSKTLLFCNNMPEQYEEFFEDGINCVMFENDLSNFKEKLTYYLENDEERESIINKAYELAIDNYTWKHMALNLLKEIEELKSDNI